MCCKALISLIELCCMTLISASSAVIRCICGGVLVFSCASSTPSKWTCLNFSRSAAPSWLLKFVASSAVLKAREWVFSCSSRAGMISTSLF